MKEILIKISKGATVPMENYGGDRYENRSFHFTGELRTDEDVVKEEEYAKLNDLMSNLIKEEVNKLKGIRELPVDTEIVYDTVIEITDKEVKNKAELLCAISESKTEESLTAVGKIIAKKKNEFTAESLKDLRAEFNTKMKSLKG